MTDRSRRLRVLCLVLAAIDIVALLLFLGVYWLDRSAVTAWVRGSPVYAGLIRQRGVDWAAGYAVVSTSAVHVVISLLFVWLAVVIVRWGRVTRVLATVLMAVAIVANLAAATSPVGGVAQLLVMAVSVVLKLVALWLLWAPAADRVTVTPAAADRRR